MLCAHLVRPIPDQLHLVLHVHLHAVQARVVGGDGDRRLALRLDDGLAVAELASI